jgi:hypothetical protein
MSDLPIVCTLQPGELSARAMEKLPGIAALAVRRQQIENGYRLEFAADKPSLTEIVTMIEAERRCCRFLRFRLTAEADHGPVSLEITGPRGTQEFLGDLVNPAT